MSGEGGLEGGLPHGEGKTRKPGRVVVGVDEDEDIVYALGQRMQCFDQPVQRACLLKTSVLPRLLQVLIQDELFLLEYLFRVRSRSTCMTKRSYVRARSSSMFRSSPTPPRRHLAQEGTIPTDTDVLEGEENDSRRHDGHDEGASGGLAKKCAMVTQSSAAHWSSSHRPAYLCSIGGRR